MSLKLLNEALSKYAPNSGLQGTQASTLITLSVKGTRVIISSERMAQVRARYKRYNGAPGPLGRASCAVVVSRE